MHRRKIPVACIQTSAHDRDAFNAAWPLVVDSVERSAAAGALLIVLPEATVPAYVLGTQPVTSDVLERAARDLASVAKRYATTIVYGAAKIADGVTYNAAIAIGPDGCELGYAAKQFLWHFDRLWFAPGNTLQPIDTPIGKLGLLVCADGRIPSIAATLVERGAELLVMPTAWVTSGRDPAHLENVQADLMVNVRARENGVAFVAANKCGTERSSVAYCGKSSIVDASGTVVARAGERHGEVVAATVEIGPSAVTIRSSSADALQPNTTERAIRARVAFTPAIGDAEIARLSASARQAGARAVLSGADVAGDVPFRTLEIAAGLYAAEVNGETFFSPRGLVPARLRGFDLFVCKPGGDAAWHVPVARTRATELRAYMIVFSDAGRAFAVDPDGIVIAGTFENFRVAAFAYDSARAAATEVAPWTDVLRGLAITESIRAGAIPPSAHV